MIKNFIDLNDFNKSELRKFLNFAKKIKNNPNKFNSLLKNKSLGLIFEKQSVRTRVSFLIGMQKLGGNVVELEQNQIGFGIRESAEDILKVLSKYIDVLMIRNDDHKLLSYLASLNILPVINGLSNYSHPCQVLSDIFTIEEIKGKIENKTITWFGDINNVLISLIHASKIFKFKLNILTADSIIKKNNKLLDNLNLNYVNFHQDIDSGVKNTDCIMTDVWVSMGEKNSINKKKILKEYQVNEKIMKKVNKKTIFMHCLPAHRNEEVTSCVIDSKQSIVLRQAENRLFVQQSILYFLLNDVKK
tara:strand:- start:2151 stop:3059 length:909 start_codon:yes stop_codon:yes gene_type:complete